MAFIDYGAFEPPNKPPYHKHRDYLNLGLWAEGVEMISEMGYAMTPPWVQKWQVSPMAHNTVLQAAEQTVGGKPLLWHITPGPQMAEAGLPPANSRFIALLPRDGADPIIVDIFRVSGDAPEYTWAMHGRSDELEVRGAPGLQAATVEAPLRNGRKAEVKEGVAEAIWRFPGDRKSGLKVLFPVLQPFTMIASECPAEEDVIKTAFLSGGNPKPGTPVPYRGHVQMKKSGAETMFVAVYVPFAGETEPAAKASCKMLEADSLGLKIDAGEDSFILIHGLQIGKREFSGLSLDGRAGVARLSKGAVRELAFGDGRALTYGEAGIYRSTLGNAYRSMN